MGQGPKNRSSRGNEAQRLQSFRNSPAHERMTKRQRTATLQDAVATDCVPLIPRGLGVRLSSAAFLPCITSAATHKVRILLNRLHYLAHVLQSQRNDLAFEGRPLGELKSFWAECDAKVSCENGHLRVIGICQ